MRNASIVRLLVTHFLAVIGEWAVTIGLLVHAHDWGGSRAVGFASMTVLLPPLVGAPMIAALLARRRTHAVRVAALGVQAAAYGAAWVSAAAGSPTPVVAVFVAIGVTVMAAVPPTSAALLPRIARSADELIGANLWLTHCDSSSALIGSLLAGVVVGVGGPAAVFAAATGGALVGIAASVWRPGSLVRSARGSRRGDQRRLIRQALGELRERPWSLGVLGVASARNLVVGTFDVALVIVALEVLDLGDAGAGYLAALVGGGALASTLVTTVAVRRARLLPTLITVVSVAAAATIVVGVRTDRLVVFVLLPVVGVCMASMDALGRTLLQRSTDPRNLGALYAALGMVAAGGQIVGSGLAQIVIALAGPQQALVVLGSVLVTIAAVVVRSLRRADDHAEVPVVEMALLAGLPMLSSLTTSDLEAVARSARTVSVAPGEALARAGERADSCYVVADGELELRANGAAVRTVARGGIVNDVALLASITTTTDVVAVGPASVVRVEREPFLLAVTGFEPDLADGIDFSSARHRFREVIENHARSTDASRADSWLSLGAAGRLVGDPAFPKILARSASLARSEQNGVLLAEAAAMTTWPGSFFFIAENPDHEMIAVCEAALEVLPGHDPMRPRVLATLASNLTFASSAERRRAIVDEALTLAEGHRDPALTAAVLNAEYMCLWEPGTIDRREEIAERVESIGTAVGDDELAWIGGFFAAYCAAERGRLRESREALVGLRAHLLQVHNQYFEFLCDRLTLSIDIATGVPDLQPRIDALAARHGTTYADTDGTWALQVGALAYQAGDLGSMVPVIASMLDGPHARTWRAALALAHLMAGDETSASKVLAEQGDVPRSYFWITVRQVQAEVAASLRITDRCRVIFEELSPYRGRVGITSSGTLCFGLVSRSLGELALALDRVDEAVELLTDAAASAADIGMPFESVLARRLLATALRRSGASEAATGLAVETLADARRGGFDRETRLLQAFVAG